MDVGSQISDFSFEIHRGGIDDNLTVIGDWFSAEAVIPHYSGGLRQTVVARHGPTVLNRLARFKRELADALDTTGVSAADSRRHAVEVLTEVIGGRRGWRGHPTGDHRR